MNPLTRRGLIAGIGGATIGATLDKPVTTPRRPALSPRRWAVDYGPATDPQLARRYDLLVLEPHHPRALAPLRGPGATLLGYISLGQVDRSRPYHAELDRAGALRAAHPDWPDARQVDLRHPAWRRLLIDRAIPAILAKGYDGIFIDTLDDAEAMERGEADAKGMIAAGAALVLAIRAAFPAMRVMVNRGYALLPDVAGAIDAVLGEAMASRWNFAANRYEPTSASDRLWQADRLRAARRINPALVLATLDYWDPADPAAVAALYREERAQGFLPYVSTLALDRLWPEPAA